MNNRLFVIPLIAMFILAALSECSAQMVAPCNACGAVSTVSLRHSCIGVRRASTVVMGGGCGCEVSSGCADSCGGCTPLADSPLVPMPDRNLDGNEGQSPGDGGDDLPPIPNIDLEERTDIRDYLTNSLADVPETASAVIEYAGLRPDGVIVVRGTVDDDAQREQVKAHGEQALQSYIDAGDLELGGMPVIDVSELVSRAGSVVRPGLAGEAYYVSALDSAIEARQLAPAPREQNVRVDQAYREAAAYCYGQAYHAYWKGDLDTSLGHLTQAIEYCPTDARLWYYKGLAEYGLQRTAASATSLAEAVMLDATQPDQSRSVSTALERIQGHLREVIETTRCRVLSAKRPAALPGEKIAASFDH